MLKTSATGGSRKKAGKSSKELRPSGQVTKSVNGRASDKTVAPGEPAAVGEPPAPAAAAEETLDVLSTRQVAQLLGVGEATVKRWADSGEIDCFRTVGGHRKFRLRDVTAFVQKRDYETVTPLPANAAANIDEAQARFEKASLGGDADACIAQMAGLRLRGLTLADIFDDVVGPALHKVGSRWEKCQLSVAEEHVATNTVIEAIARSQPLAEPPGEPNRADKGTAVVASVAGEQHDVAARMAACLLRARCFEVLAPLAQTPARDLAELIVRTRAQVVALCSTYAASLAQIQEQVDMASQAVQLTGGTLFTGGPGMDRIKLPAGVRLLTRMADLVAEAEPMVRRRASRG
jgi:MerR family transcriptional regulator, light-induced transcriptional regulator